MYEILMVIYLVVALVLIGIVLIQKGKGAGMGSAFGSGASGTVFGAGGSGTFLTRATTVLAIVFFGVALGLGNITSDKTIKVEENTLFSGDTAEQTSSDIPVESDLPVSEIPEEAAKSEDTDDLPTTEDSTTKDDTDSK
ncbi:MAG: preprotein translocase subunit SecG [Gammaproteobacteria bacterium]|nr:MAG: preprotein translocase subunit SecG [Gammaproteobacteria bacterium]